MNVNKAIVIGYLTREPELRYGANGTPVCSFTVATNSNWKDASGERRQETEFHTCVAFGALGERVAAYMSKGSHICVEGRLKTDRWEHGDHMHYRTKIIAERATFGTKKDRESEAGGDVSEDVHQPVADHMGPDDDVPF
jgi:single-strand DNA-binding protein